MRHPSKLATSGPGVQPAGSQQANPQEGKKDRSGGDQQPVRMHLPLTASSSRDDGGDLQSKLETDEEMQGKPDLFRSHCCPTQQGQPAGQGLGAPSTLDGA